MRPDEKARPHTGMCTSKLCADNPTARPPSFLSGSCSAGRFQVASGGWTAAASPGPFPGRASPGQLSRRLGPREDRRRTASVGKRQTAATRSAETSCDKLLPPVNELISISSYIYIPKERKQRLHCIGYFFCKQQTPECKTM